MVVFANAFLSTTDTALAFSAALCASLGFVYFERAVKHNLGGPNTSHVKSTNPFEKSTVSPTGAADLQDNVLERCVRETAIYFALATGFAALAFEPIHTLSLGLSLQSMISVIFFTIQTCLAFFLVSLNTNLLLPKPPLPCDWLQ